MRDITLMRRLAYAGALPFIAAALWSVGQWSWPDLAVVPLVQAYGLAILSFMAGVHWATALYCASDAPINLLLSSNAITVAAWLSYGFAPDWGVWLAQMIGFALILWIDARLYRAGLIDAAYWRMRWQVSAVVLLCLAVMLATARI